MPDLPSGAVTFLFTDVEGSTRLLKQLRERYGEALAEHQRLLREAFGEYRGEEIDTQGDSFFVAFSHARDAVLASVAAQRSLAGHTWPAGAQFKVRMGIHTGQAAVAADRYLGLGVHRAARICAAGHGGQVLVSQTTVSLLEDEEEELPGIELRDLGERRLKDLARPVRLYQLVADDLPSEFPPLHAGDGSPFEGRERELAHAAEAAMARVRRRRRLLLGFGAVAAAAAIAVVATLLALTGGSNVTVRPNSVGMIDPKRNRVIAQLSVGARPQAITAASGSVWVANLDDKTLSRINSRSHTVVRTISLAATPTGVASGADAVWVANGLLGSVSRVDPSFNAVSETIRTPLGRSSFGAVAVGDGAVWAAFATGEIARIDPTRRRLVATGIAGFAPAAIAVGEGAVWVANSGDNTVVRFDPVSNSPVRTITVGRQPRGIAVGEGAVWVTNAKDGVVTRIDPSSNSTTTIDVGAGPLGIAVGAGAVWVADAKDGAVSRIDPRTNRVVATIPLGNSPQALVVADGAVWVTVQRPG